MAGNYVLLETIQLTQSAASVTFDNIPQTGYTDLKIVAGARSNRSSQGDYILLSFNGTTTSYSAKIIEGSGSSVGNDTTARCAGIMNSATSTGNVFGNNEIYIPNYTSSNYKSYSADGVSENNATDAYQDLVAGLWSNTAAITSVTLSPNVGTSFDTYSTFSLYGVAALGTTPTVAPKATGGNIVANDGTYWYHAFLTSGNFVPQIPLTCDYLVIAGGGSGGSADGSGWGGGGGGGAGGYRTSIGGSALSLSNIVYPVAVGAGGSGASGFQGANGTNSNFSTITSTGGGGGGRGSATAINRLGSNGGSGGGGGYSNGTGGTGIAGQGYAGGNTSSGNGGGGGGGATTVGGNATLSGSTHLGGTGGAGSNSASTWASVTTTGVSGYYAGGGGGGSNSLGAGGSGGGGNGGNNTGTNPTSAVGNTGSGGGGFYDIGAGGNGGSGIVIIRYAMV